MTVPFPWHHRTEPLGIFCWWPFLGQMHLWFRLHGTQQTGSGIFLRSPGPVCPPGCYLDLISWLRLQGSQHSRLLPVMRCNVIVCASAWRPVSAPPLLRRDPTRTHSSAWWQRHCLCDNSCWQSACGREYPHLEAVLSPDKSHPAPHPTQPLPSLHGSQVATPRVSVTCTKLTSVKAPTIVLFLTTYYYSFTTHVKHVYCWKFLNVAR